MEYKKKETAYAHHTMVLFLLNLQIKHKKLCIKVRGICYIDFEVYQFKAIFFLLSNFYFFPLSVKDYAIIGHEQLREEL